MTDHGITDFVEPVDAVQSQSGKNSFIVFLIDFCPVHIENNGQNKNKGPVEIIGASNLYLADQIFGIFDCSVKTVYHSKKANAIRQIPVQLENRIEAESAKD